MKSRAEIEDAYIKYADMMTRVCYLHLKNSEDTKDVIQDVFVKFFLKDGPFNDENHERAWLLRVTINKCNDVKKSFWKKNITSINDVEIVFNQKVESDVMRELCALPNKYKVPIYLSYYEGYTVPEIAKILEQKENTVYSNINRGRKIMKEKLGGELYGETY